MTIRLALKDDCKSIERFANSEKTMKFVSMTLKKLIECERDFSKIIFISLSILVNGCVSHYQSSGEPTMSRFKPPSKIVIAHRGASGYLPEHSPASTVASHVMGADYIEQDVVMTKDDYLVVLHDPYLDRVTNVMELFPNRSRKIFGQKRWLAIDFTLKEIKQLSMTEGFKLGKNSTSKVQIYPNRFPMFKSHFQVSTLEEQIELIQGMNKSRGKDIGIYVEIKAPWLHQLEKKDISLRTLEVIKKYGYTNKKHKVFIQCFDPDETKRINDELMPMLGLDLKLVQLIAETDWRETMRLVEGELVPYDYSWMFKKGAMIEIAKYADGIGPWKPMLVSDQSTKDNIILTEMVSSAKDQGLVIHPFSFRKELDRIPSYAKNFEDLLDIFFYQVGVDGVFTDFPDLAVKFIESENLRAIAQ